MKKSILLVAGISVFLLMGMNSCEAIKNCCKGKSCKQTEQSGTCTKCGKNSCSSECPSQAQADTTNIKK